MNTPLHYIKANYFFRKRSKLSSNALQFSRAYPSCPPKSKLTPQPSSQSYFWACSLAIFPTYIPSDCMFILFPCTAPVLNTLLSGRVQDRWLSNHWPITTALLWIRGPTVCTGQPPCLSPSMLGVIKKEQCLKFRITNLEGTWGRVTECVNHLILILQMKILKFRDATWLAQGCDCDSRKTETRTTFQTLHYTAATTKPEVKVKKCL